MAQSRHGCSVSYVSTTTFNHYRYYSHVCIATYNRYYLKNIQSLWSEEMGARWVLGWSRLSPSLSRISQNSSDVTRKYSTNLDGSSELKYSLWVRNRSISWGTCSDLTYSLPSLSDSDAIRPRRAAFTLPMNLPNLINSLYCLKHYITI